MRERGVLFTFEGGEGVGKTTTIARLADELRGGGFDVVVTREPGAGRLGSAIRNVLLDVSDLDVDPRAEALLFAADRAQHVAEVIAPALRAGSVVLCDRYLDSSVAYQGYARGLGEQEVEHLSLWGTGGLLPDLTFLLDLDPVIGMARAGRRGAADRLESAGDSFHVRVRDGFLRRAAANPDRVRVIDASGSSESVYADISRHVLAHLAR
jgi:dTMP kinase